MYMHISSVTANQLRKPILVWVRLHPVDCLLALFSSVSCGGREGTRVAGAGLGSTAERRTPPSGSYFSERETERETKRQDTKASVFRFHSGTAPLICYTGR